MGAQRACSYCGALLQVPAPAPVALAPPPAPARSAGAAWVVPVIALLGVAVAVGIAAFRSVTASMSAPAAPAAQGAEGASQKPSGIAWRRLEAIEIHATVDQAKVAMKQQFPEAKVVQDKEYRLDLDHPILSSVDYSWEWGCSCLEGAVFFYKDYPTRMKTDKAFIPCLTRGLGPIAASAPPFDYDWPAHGDVPHVHMGPQILSVDIAPGTSEASYRTVLRVLDGCRN